MGAGAPNRPLPPTPDEDANERTLIMKRVSHHYVDLLDFLVKTLYTLMNIPRSLFPST